MIFGQLSKFFIKAIYLFQWLNPQIVKFYNKTFFIGENELASNASSKQIAFLYLLALYICLYSRSDSCFGCRFKVK